MYSSNTTIWPRVETNNNNVDSDEGLLVPPDSGTHPATLLHTTFAKVYTMPISPTKKTWQSQTRQPVPISFYFDKQRNVYRILSYGEGDKLVVNSTIVPSTSFLKTSPFFGLWSDRKLRVIFGLGFASQPVCDMTSDWFEKVVKAATTLQQQSFQAKNSISSRDSQRPIPLPPFESHDTNDAQLKPTATKTLLESELPERRLKITNLTAKIPDPPALNTEEYSPNTDRIATAVGEAIRQQSFKSLQQDDEKDRKLAELESELAEQKFNYGQAQENLKKRMGEEEKLLEQVKGLGEQLRIQINRAERAENLHNEERRRANSLELEMGQLNAIIAQQIVSINDVQGERRQLEEESKMLRDSLKSFKNRMELNVDETDKDLGNLEMACKEIGSKVEDLLKIQTRLQNNLKNTKV